MGRTFPAGYEALGRIPWRGPGCTGIIAKNAHDGTVWHARNLDFAPVPFMTHLVYNGVFTKNGQEIYTAQMIAGYTQAITGIRRGKNGWALERNTRYTDHVGGNEEMLTNIFAGSSQRYVLFCLSKGMCVCGCYYNSVQLFAKKKNTTTTTTSSRWLSLVFFFLLFYYFY